MTNNTRRNFFGKMAALAAAVSGGSKLLAQQAAPEIKFKAPTDFFKMPPDLYFGEVAGAAVNSKGHAFVLSCGDTTGHGPG